MFERNSSCFRTVVTLRVAIVMLTCAVTSFAAFLPQKCVDNSNSRCIPSFRSEIIASPAVRSKSTSLAASVGKSGGRLLETAEAFAANVLDETLEKPVLVFFSAPWCGPCRLSNPVVKDIKKQFSNEIDVVEICTDDLPDVASDADVVSIPTIQVYHRGNVLDTIVGCVAKNILASAITKILEEI
mmetsp:Transcript_8896/g.13190  ORF Transcript_8896/g.13190 Transcript_8896/m.13190 type:complete len:185 (-) Transcript_8896:108-662(-)